nr:protoglobin domain-containing protein [Rhodobacter amnigenus]
MPNRESVNDVMHKFRIGPEDLALVRAAGSVILPEIDDHIEEFYHWLAVHDEYQTFFSHNEGRLARVKSMQVLHWKTFFEAQIDAEWMASRRHVGAVHAHINLPNDIYFAGVCRSSESIIRRLRHMDDRLEQIEATIDSVGKLMFFDAFVVIEEIARSQREKIEAGSKALLEMSTPVTPIWEGILLLPLVGVIDSERTQDIMTKTLNKIAETRARVFVLDISGVGAMDTAVANQLIKITRATQLMGCETIISGVSPTIARTLVELGVNVGDVRTTATLRDSFELALRSVGAGRELFGSERPVAG